MSDTSTTDDGICVEHGGWRLIRNPEAEGHLRMICKNNHTLLRDVTFADNRCNGDVCGERMSKETFDILYAAKIAIYRMENKTLYIENNEWLRKARSVHVK